LGSVVELRGIPGVDMQVIIQPCMKKKVFPLEDKENHDQAAY
jgi:hypothetical protein